MTICYNALMGLSEFQESKILKQKKKAAILYKQGLPLREVGKALVPPRSHEWVRQSLFELGVVDKQKVEQEIP